MPHVSIQYVQDANGTIQAVQMPLNDWKKVVNAIRKYEQTLQLKSDITKALSEVQRMRSGKLKKTSMPDFLNEL
jgi:hypothetical protein